MAEPALRLGTDIVDVRSVEASIERFGRRYLERVYTDAEIAYCRAGPGGGAERFAARFAAKEATLKVLRPEDWRPEWRDIEVVREDGGWCEIRLRGPAAALAEQRGIQVVSCSLAHERSYATAVVLGAPLHSGQGAPKGQSPALSDPDAPPTDQQSPTDHA